MISQTAILLPPAYCVHCQCDYHKSHCWNLIKRKLLFLCVNPQITWFRKFLPHWFNRNDYEAILIIYEYASRKYLRIISIQVENCWTKAEAEAAAMAIVNTLEYMTMAYTQYKTLTHSLKAMNILEELIALNLF